MHVKNDRVLQKGKYLQIIFTIILLIVTDIFWPDSQLSYLKSNLLISLTIILLVSWNVGLHSYLINKMALKVHLVSSVITLLGVILNHIRLVYLPDVPLHNRYFWYLSCIPVIFVPLFFLVVVFNIDRNILGRLSEHYRWLYLPVVLVGLLILTNDLHGQLFSTSMKAGHAYAPRLLFAVIILWYICVAGMLTYIYFVGSALIKKRLKGQLLTLFTGTIYNCAVCIMSPQIYSKSVCIFTALLNTLLWDINVRREFILSSVRYSELLSAISFEIKITDRDYNIYYSSKKATPVSDEQRDMSTKDFIILDKNRRLYKKAIKGGYMFWQDDITLLNQMLDKLAASQQFLNNSNEVLSDENRLKELIVSVKTKNDLYDQIADEVSPAIGELERLVEQAEYKSEDEKRMLYAISFVGGYIKRRANIIIIGKDISHVQAMELVLCIRESVTCMRKYGISCTFNYDVTGLVSTRCVKCIYDCFFNSIALAYKVKTVDIEICIRKKVFMKLFITCEIPFEKKSLLDAVRFCELSEVSISIEESYLIIEVNFRQEGNNPILLGDNLC